MLNTVTTSLNSLLEPFSRCLDAESARKVSEFHVDDVVEARIQTLAELANEGLLTPDERSEYESLVNAIDLISILKLKAIRYLAARCG